MTRRQQLENIIIGTLLESTEEDNYFLECGCSVSEYMFEDPVNRQIYKLVADMNRRGKVHTSPWSLLMEYGREALDIAPDMCERCMKYSFVALKTKYNEDCYMASLIDGLDYGYTNVQFSDYVNNFLTLVYHEERQAS